MIRYAIDTICHEYVEGWALGVSGPCAVEVVVDGRSVGWALTLLQRPDVGEVLADVPRSADAGFRYAFGEGDLVGSPRHPRVWLVFRADGETAETERFEIPCPAEGETEGPLPRSCLPPTVTEVLLRTSPELASGDLTSEAGASAAIEVLDHLAQRGPRPLPAVHRYVGYLRSVSGATAFATRYFPKVNARPTSEKDKPGMLTSPSELTAIAHHLFVLRDAGVEGAVLEFGCYKGYSTSVLSTACRLLGRELHVFDSFEGLPPTTSMHYRSGEFAADLEEVRRNVMAFGHPEVVTFWPGFFSDSVPRWRPRPVMCLWMDVDLERSSVDALGVLPNLDPRGALFSHECGEIHFSDGRPVPHPGPEEVVGPIVDAFAGAGRRAVGRFLFGNTGAFWDARAGIAVLPPASFARLMELVRR